LKICVVSESVKTHSYKTRINCLNYKNASLPPFSQLQFLFLFNSTLFFLILIRFSFSLESEATFGFVANSSMNILEQILHPHKLEFLPLSPFSVLGCWLLLWSWLKPHYYLCSYVLGSSRLIWCFTDKNHLGVFHCSNLGLRLK